jgi:hypothetical protein
MISIGAAPWVTTTVPGGRTTSLLCGYFIHREREQGKGEDWVQIVPVRQITLIASPYSIMQRVTFANFL